MVLDFEMTNVVKSVGRIESYLVLTALCETFNQYLDTGARQ